MNSLPPELVSSIIETAAECSSFYESYKERLQTLSALALVNHTFHEIAQPLLPLRIYLKQRTIEYEATDSQDSEIVETDPKEEFENLMEDEMSHKVTSLAFQPARSAWCYSLLRLYGFSNLTEIRLVDCCDMSLKTFSAQQHLKRLTLDGGYIHYDPATDEHLALFNVIELTMETIKLVVPESHPSGTPLFLTETHFPSLRVLGLVKYTAVTLTTASKVIVPPHPSFLTRLDCLITDNDTDLSSLPLPVPFLYDVDPALFLWDEIPGQTSLQILFSGPRPTVDLEPAFTKPHVRIRFPCKTTAEDKHIEAALSFVETLLVKSTVLAELYLDLYPRNGRREYVLVQNLEEKIEKLENLAKEKKVEIVWENHEDDWCRSRVSKEFWRRCKEKDK